MQIDVATINDLIRRYDDQKITIAQGIRKFLAGEARFIIDLKKWSAHNSGAAASQSFDISYPHCTSLSPEQLDSLCEILHAHSAHYQEKKGSDSASLDSKLYDELFKLFPLAALLTGKLNRGEIFSSSDEWFISEKYASYPMYEKISSLLQSNLSRLSFPDLTKKPHWEPEDIEILLENQYRLDMTLALRELANVELLEYKNLILSAPEDVAKTQDRIRHLTSKPEGKETKLPSSFLLRLNDAGLLERYRQFILENPKKTPLIDIALPVIFEKVALSSTIFDALFDNATSDLNEGKDMLRAIDKLNEYSLLQNGHEAIIAFTLSQPTNSIKIAADYVYILKIFKRFECNSSVKLAEGHFKFLFVLADAFRVIEFGCKDTPTSEQVLTLNRFLINQILQQPKLASAVIALRLSDRLTRSNLIALVKQPKSCIFAALEMGGIFNLDRDPVSRSLKATREIFATLLKVKNRHRHEETENTQSQSRFFQQVPRELLAKVAGYTNKEVGSDTAERYLYSLMHAPQI